MGYRYQDATGRIQLAQDIHVLHQALKAGRLSPDSMVLDESVKIRLKAAALIAFKAREAVQARANATPAGSAAAGRLARPAAAVRSLPHREALPAPGASGRSKQAAWLLGISLIGMLVLGLIGLQYFLAESSAAPKAAAEPLNATADQPGAGALHKPGAPTPDEGRGKGESAKQLLGREELLKSVLPLLRKTHEEMLQNNARYHQGVDHLNLGQSMAPEVLLSRDGLARNAIRIQSFNGTLERFAQAEEARMRRLMEDVHRALDNRVGAAEFVKGFEAGLSRSRQDHDAFIRIQRELAGLFQQVTDFMLARHDSVSLRSGTLAFASEADAATYQHMMKDLDRLAREESAVQRRMLDTMTHMGEMLDEWSK